MGPPKSIEIYKILSPISLSLSQIKKTRHPHLTFVEHPMDELSKNVVLELVRDSSDPSESWTGDKRYYSVTQTDVWVTVTCEKDGSWIVNPRTCDTYFSRPSKEKKLFFNCCHYAPQYIWISFFLVKARTKRIKCVSQTGVIFSQSRPATHIWRELHHVGAATPYARCRDRLARAQA